MINETIRALHRLTMGKLGERDAAELMQIWADAATRGGYDWEGIQEHRRPWTAWNLAKSEGMEVNYWDEDKPREIWTKFEEAARAGGVVDMLEAYVRGVPLADLLGR